jgi:replication-associated recombination protein RarA
MSLFDGFALSHPTLDHVTNLQTGFEFPQQLTEKYRPQELADFAGLDKQKRILANFAAKPYPSSWLFTGASGTGKTTMAIALAAAIPAEVHHVPSQECTVARMSEIRQVCQYVPMQGFKMHFVLVDEADQMSPAAQVSLLSKLDATNFPPSTVFVFTCNSTERLEPRFLSRCKVLEFSTYGLAAEATELLSRVWKREKPGTVDTPNFARIVKESNNNVREALNRLETELLA